MKKEMLAVCGVNCAACSAFLNKQKPCPACRAPEQEQLRKSCINCAIKRCAFEKGLNWCFECASFPCPRIKRMSKRYGSNYHVDLIQNGLDAKADMDVFLAVQMKRFTCVRCGGRIDQHRGCCNLCRATVLSEKE